MNVDVKEVASDRLHNAYKDVLFDLKRAWIALGESLPENTDGNDPIGSMYGSMNHIVTMMEVGLKEFEVPKTDDSGFDMLQIYNSIINALDVNAMIFTSSPLHAMIFFGVRDVLQETRTTYLNAVATK